MTKILLALILVLATATAGAVNSADHGFTEDPLEYCKGFVVSGLASKVTGGTARVDLWLAWNYVIRSGAISDSTDSAEFQSGHEQFQTVSDAATVVSILQEADGSCGLGRSGHQITGW